MISNEDKRRVCCAFNSNHKMPVQRYPWHLARCPDHKFRIQSGLPIYKCPHHNLHIFLSNTALEHHLVICEQKTNPVKEDLEDLSKVILGKRCIESSPT